MTRHIVSSVKRGVHVKEDYEGEAIRSQICLCLHCVRLVTQEDVEELIEPIEHPDLIPSEWKNVQEDRQIRIEELKRAFNCPTAQANFDNCIIGEVAAPITRCPMFVERWGIKKEGK